MKKHALAARILFASVVLVPALWGQRHQGGGGDTPDGGGAGGTWAGPGDTVAGGGNGGSGGNNGPTPPKNPPPTNPNPPGDKPGTSPLAPRTPPPGAEGTPGSPGEAPPPKPNTPPRTETLNSWQTWWHYNRWAHLEVGSGLLVGTGTGGFFLGHGEKAQVAPLLRATQNQVRDIVQPALTRALARGGSAEFEIYALHALAKIRSVPVPEGTPDFASVVRSYLRNANQFVAEKAVLSLGIRGEDEFLPWLAAVLADSSEGRDLVGRSIVGDRLRAFAAYGLGLLGERTREARVRVGVHDALMAALPAERDEVQAACLLALGFVPMPAGDSFVEGGGELFRGKTRVDQVLAVLAFFEDTAQSFLARTQAPNALARLVQDAPDSLRGRVSFALLVASGPLSHEQREVQNAAIIALGKIGKSGQDPIDQEIRNHLERVAFKSSADRSTRYLATIALAEVATRRGSGEEPFAGLEPTRRALQRNLRSRGETLAWTALALGVLEEDASTRGEAASPDSGKLLRSALEKARSSEIAGALAIALGMVRDPEAAELLISRMKEAGDDYMRGYAALALGMIGVPGAIEPIRELLGGSTNQYFVVENASIALGLLGDQGTGTRLFEVLDRSGNPKVQASVASAMGWIRDPRPLANLCTLLGDSRRNDAARAWTSVAIGRICDQDRWPWVGRMSVDVQYDVVLPTLLEPIYETGLLDLP